MYVQENISVGFSTSPMSGIPWVSGNVPPAEKERLLYFDFTEEKQKREKINRPEHTVTEHGARWKSRWAWRGSEFLMRPALLILPCAHMSAEELVNMHMWVQRFWGGTWKMAGVASLLIILWVAGCYFAFFLKPPTFNASHLHTRPFLLSSPLCSCSCPTSAQKGSSSAYLNIHWSVVFLPS